MVMDQKTGKPRGYAFIEYEHERDMHGTYMYRYMYVHVCVYCTVRVYTCVM